MLNRIKEYKENLKKHFEEVMRIKASPHSIASGFTIGTAISIFPTFGLGILIGLLVLLIFKKVSKISMFAAFVIWNPLINLSLYGLAYSIGDFLLKGAPITSYGISSLNEVYAYSSRLLAGNLIILTVVIPLSYAITYYLAKKYQRQYKEFIEKPIEGAIEQVEENLHDISLALKNS